MLYSKKRSVSAVAALIGLCGFSAPAVLVAEDVPSRQPFRIQRATEMIGKPVQDKRGERLGEVQDLAIDGERGRVAYVVLSFGGILGMGEKWFAIPTGALPLSPDGKHFVLAVDKERLETAPGFDKKQWPTMGNSTWDTEVHEFYGLQPYWISDSTMRANTRIQRASDIMGRSVQNDRGETLGEIQDLVIDPDQHRVAYVVMSFGGFLGFGDKLFAIPSGVLQMPGSGEYAVLRVEKEQLKNATGFDKNSWPNLADPTLSTGIHDYYGQRPYWTEDLRGGHYLASAAGTACHQCNRTTVASGFVRDGDTFCCAGCANKTGCTCLPMMEKARP